MRVKTKKPKIWSELLSERGSEEVFHVYHTNQTLGKRGLGKWTIHPPSTSNNESYKPKKHEICSNSLSKRVYEIVFYVYNSNQTLGTTFVCSLLFFNLYSNTTNIGLQIWIFCPVHLFRLVISH